MKPAAALVFSLSLLIVGVFCLLPQQHGFKGGIGVAHAQPAATGAGRTSPIAPPVGCVGAGYVGPGDVAGAGSPLAWWGMRAFKATLCGNALMNVCNTTTAGTDLACADILSSASTGDVVTQSLSAVTCPSATLVVCTFAKLYDQTVGGNCTGSCDMITANGALQRGTVFAANTGCGNTRGMCLTTITANAGGPTNTLPPVATAGNMTLAVPWTIVQTMVTSSIGNTSAFSVLFVVATNYESPQTTILTGYCDSTSGINNNTPTTANTTYSIAWQCTAASGGTGFFTKNGTAGGTVNSMGTATMVGTPYMLFANANNNYFYTTEIGVYSGTLSNTVLANLHTNMSAWYGY